MKYITKSKEKLKLHGFSTYYISMEKEKYNAFALTMGRLCVGINLRVVFFFYYYYYYQNGGKSR